LLVASTEPYRPTCRTCMQKWPATVCQAIRTHGALNRQCQRIPGTFWLPFVLLKQCTNFREIWYQDRFTPSQSIFTLYFRISIKSREDKMGGAYNANWVEEALV
jgi:hypothetical protein